MLFGACLFSDSTFLLCVLSITNIWCANVGERREWGTNFKISYSKLIEKPLVLWRKVQWGPDTFNIIIFHHFVLIKVVSVHRTTFIERSSQWASLFCILSLLWVLSTNIASLLLTLWTRTKFLITNIKGGAVNPTEKFRQNSINFKLTDSELDAEMAH